MQITPRIQVDECRKSIYCMHANSPLTEGSQETFFDTWWSEQITHLRIFSIRSVKESCPVALHQMACEQLMVVGQNGHFYAHMERINPSRKHLCTRPRPNWKNMRGHLGDGPGEYNCPTARAPFGARSSFRFATKNRCLYV